MKVYRVARSIFGELGSLKRRETLAEDDQRIVNNPTAVKELIKRRLLMLEEPVEAPKAKRRAAQPDPNPGPEGA